MRRWIAIGLLLSGAGLASAQQASEHELLVRKLLGEFARRGYAIDGEAQRYNPEDPEHAKREDDFAVVDACDPFEHKYGHVPGSGILLVASSLASKGKTAELVTGGVVDWMERDYPIEKGMS